MLLSDGDKRFGRELTIEVRAKPADKPTPLVTFPAEEPTPTPTPTPSPVPSPSPSAGPGPVQNVAAGTEDQPAGSVIVTWNANPASDGIDHYNVYRKDDPEADGEPDCGGEFSDPPIATVLSGGPTFKVDTPPGTGEYCYAVRAVDGDDNEGPLHPVESIDWVEVA
jgi:hypothetical protein